MPRTVAHTLIPALGRQGNHCEFQASQGTQGDLISKKTKQKNIQHHQQKTNHHNHCLTLFGSPIPKYLQAPTFLCFSQGLGWSIRKGWDLRVRPVQARTLPHSAFERTANQMGLKIILWDIPIALKCFPFELWTQD